MRPKLSSLINTYQISDLLAAVDQLIQATVLEPNINSRLIKPDFLKKSKKLRPILCLSVARANSNNNNDPLVQAATALELLHQSSLIHDDIIDKSLTRHNQPTINANYGSAKALVGGDYLVGQAFLSSSELDPRINYQLATSYIMMCEGQQLELQDQHNPNRSIKSYLKAIEGKTAALFQKGTLIGGILGNYNQSQLLYLEKFGQYFGVFYQLMDDLLDIYSSQELLQKDVLKDFYEGNFTYPYLLLKEQNPYLMTSILSHNIDYAQIPKLLIQEGITAKMLRFIHSHLLKSLRSLDKVKQPSLDPIKVFCFNFLKDSIDLQVNPVDRPKLKFILNKIDKDYNKLNKDVF